jgi:hypothetical protein
VRRPHLKLVRALDAILLEGGELRERLLLRVRRDLAPLAVHRARPVCQCLRSSREVGGAKCHQGALETALIYTIKTLPSSCVSFCLQLRTTKRRSSGGC